MKTENILYIYDVLVGRQKIVRNDFCVEFGVSERTFYRYVRIISDFLRKYRSEYVIDVQNNSGEYYIKSLIYKKD